VPNIKDCQARNVWEIAEELDRLVKAARAEKLSPADLQGGTFSLSNIGAVCFLRHLSRHLWGHNS
jgi:2-oxoisovalerate dehydrogenase E2 component (dihydrolipoyl transacylase)